MSNSPVCASGIDRKKANCSVKIRLRKSGSKTLGPEDARVAEISSSSERFVGLKILVIGGYVMDVFYSGPHDPLRYVPGGKALNTAICLGRMKAEVAVLGSVGRDTGGTAVLKSLHDGGVDHRMLKKVKPPTPMCWGNTEKEESSFLASMADLARMVNTERDILGNAQAFDQAAALVLTFEVGADQLRAAIACARESDTVIVLNPAPIHAEFGAIDEKREILRLVDCITPNISEAQKLLGIAEDEEQRVPTDIARRLIVDYGVPKVCLTLGEQGSVAAWRDDGGKIFVRHVPAPYIENVIDTAGASDALTARLTAELALGVRYEDAAKLAQRTHQKLYLLLPMMRLASKELVDVRKSDTFQADIYNSNVSTNLPGLANFQTFLKETGLSAQEAIAVLDRSRLSFLEVVENAQFAGALATTKTGASTAMPTLESQDAFAAKLRDSALESSSIRTVLGG